MAQDAVDESRIWSHQQEKQGTIESQVEAWRRHAYKEGFATVEDLVCLGGTASAEPGWTVPVWTGFGVGRRPAISTPCWSSPRIDSHANMPT
jgi:hypothetical protein